MMLTKIQNELKFGDQTLITGMSPDLIVEDDPLGNGVFLSVKKSGQCLPWDFQRLGFVQALERFTATHRNEVFWMFHASGSLAKEIPGETQWLLMRLSGNRHLMIVPLYDRVARHALRGRPDGSLEFVAETADAYTIVEGGLCAFVAVTDNPYALIPAAARSVLKRLGTGRLRTDKKLPSMVDLLGWCTWTAFWGGVRKEDVRNGVASIKQAGIPLRFLILDDGWQDLKQVVSSCSLRMNGFSTVLDKFPDRLTGVGKMIRDEFGLDQLWVWHAIQGYWGGSHLDGMKEFGAEEAIMRPQGELARKSPGIMDWMTPAIGRIPLQQFGRFMDAYHASLKAEGVDGVKIDNQGSLELLADGVGGRVAYYRAAREAIETSVAKHFHGDAINCMAHQTETWYQAPETNLARTSNDFFPNRPDSHGDHLIANAQVSMWFSEFMHPDWDMFESTNPWGAYHAAARTVSGGPVYLCDKPGQHNPELVMKVVTSDGRAVRSLDPGRPSPDCLYHNCRTEDVLLKIYNRNTVGWVVGVFNAHPKVDGQPPVAIHGHVGPMDVPGIEGTAFVLYAHGSGACVRASESTALPLTMVEGEFEVVTVAPLIHGFAAIGLMNHFNAGAAILSLRVSQDEMLVKLMDGGRFLAVSESAPTSVRVDGRDVQFHYDSNKKSLTVDIEAKGIHRLVKVLTQSDHSKNTLHLGNRDTTKV